MQHCSSASLFFTATPGFKYPQSILYIFLNHAFNWGLWPLIVHVFSPTPLPLYKPLLIPSFSFHSVSSFLKLLYPFSPSFVGSMVKTSGAHSLWPWVHRTSPPAVISSPGAPFPVAPALPQPPRLPSPQLPQPLPPLPLPLLPSRAVLLLLLVWALPLWPLLIGDIIPGLAPPRLIHHTLGQPGGPYRPRGLGP